MTQKSLLRVVGSVEERKPIYTRAQQALKTVGTASAGTCDNGKMQLEGLHTVTEKSLAVLLGGGLGRSWCRRLLHGA